MIPTKMPAIPMLSMLGRYEFDANSLCPGIYLFVSSLDDSILYVGSSKFVFRRALGHGHNIARILHEQGRKFRIYCYICKDCKEALTLERRLILEYAPPYNVIGTSPDYVKMASHVLSQ